MLGLSNTLEKLEGSTSSVHAQLATMVTKAVDNELKASLKGYTKIGEMDERVSNLEEVYIFN